MNRRPPIDFPRPLFAPHGGGDGASPEHSSSPELMRKAAMLVEEETGLRFESLVLFAEPVFDHYGLDCGQAFMLSQNLHAADEGTITVLEAARMLWAYFSLSEIERTEMHDRLAAYLLGPQHEAEDEVDLEILLDRMEQHWNMLDPQDREIAENGSGKTLGLTELLEHPGMAHAPGEPAVGGYGPDHLGEVEAQALFAQPLLNRAHDPDDLEAAMDRAHAYWELAHEPPTVRRQQIPHLVKELASTPSERAAIEAEAREMLDRFDELFPERVS